MDRINPTSADSAVAAAPRSNNGFTLERAIVLDFLRAFGASSRPVIARETGLSRAVVAQRLGDLQASGLVIESGSEASSGGRPPRQVQFNTNLGHVLVADLGATSIDVAIADLGGQVLDHRSEEADIAAGPDIILGRVEELFVDLSEFVGDAYGLLRGIGIGIPGPVEFSTGRPVAPPSCRVGMDTLFVSDSPRDSAYLSGSTTTSTSWRSANEPRVPRAA